MPYIAEQQVVDWNDRRSRRVFVCFYLAIFQLTSAKFQTFAYNSRTVWSSFMKLDGNLRLMLFIRLYQISRQ